MENKEPLKTLLIRLREEKLNLARVLQTTPTAAWECSAPRSPSEALVRLGDTLKSRAAVAMHTLWESWLAWTDRIGSNYRRHQGPALHY